MKFNTVGIICEYNPFHFGHLYHINETKRITGCKNIVCIMSGSMVQRGESAIFDKWFRAKCAVDAGADLVIELPAYYVLQSAEKFAYGAVKILDDLSVVDAISFGSEMTDISLINTVAEILFNEPMKYKTALSDKLSTGAGFPCVCEYALKACIPDISDDFFMPNNILGVNYVCSTMKLGSKIKPVVIERKNDYHGFSSSDGYKSATAIRQMLLNGENVSEFSDDYSKEDVYNLKYAESFVLGFLRNSDIDSLSKTPDSEKGIANLLKKSAARACTIEELFSMCTNKRYTLHRIRRYICSAILGIEPMLCCDYARVLGFNSNGASLIKEIKKVSKLNVITKAADYSGSKMFDIDVAATDFASLCSKNIQKRYSGKDFLNSPYVYNGGIKK